MLLNKYVDWRKYQIRQRIPSFDHFISMGNLYKSSKIFAKVGICTIIFSWQSAITLTSSARWHPLAHAAAGRSKHFVCLVSGRK